MPSVVVTLIKDLQIDLGDGGDLAILTGVAVVRDLNITIGDAIGDSAFNEVRIDSSSIGRDLTPRPSPPPDRRLAGNAVRINFTRVGRG